MSHQQRPVTPNMLNRLKPIVVFRVQSRGQLIAISAGTERGIRPGDKVQVLGALYTVLTAYGDACSAGCLEDTPPPEHRLHGAVCRWMPAIHDRG